MAPAVKLCGQTRADDIAFSFAAGADFCGVVVEVPSSPRSRRIEEARALFAVNPKKTFALTADAPLALHERIARELRPGFFQLTANEPPESAGAVAREFGVPVFKSLHLPPEAGLESGPEAYLAQIEKYLAAGCGGFILDTKVPKMYGGSGKQSDWKLAGEIISRTGARLLLAGGIGPDNAARAAALGPWGLDMASGVETAPGIKSREKIELLFRVLRGGER